MGPGVGVIELERPLKILARLLCLVDRGMSRPIFIAQARIIFSKRKSSKKVRNRLPHRSEPEQKKSRLTVFSATPTPPINRGSSVAKAGSNIFPQR